MDGRFREGEGGEKTGKRSLRQGRKTLEEGRDRQGRKKRRNLTSESGRFWRQDDTILPTGFFYRLVSQKEEISMHGIIVRILGYLLKMFIDKRVVDIAFMEKILEEHRSLAKIDNIGKNELDDFHAQFRFYSSSLHRLVSNACSDEDKKKIYHALMAARVLCWALKFETMPNNEIIEIMEKRTKEIMGNNAYHSSYERFVKELSKSGWQGDCALTKDHITKVREWCRANMDELRRLKDSIKGRVKHVDLMLGIVNEISG